MDQANDPPSRQSRHADLAPLLGLGLSLIVVHGNLLGGRILDSVRTLTQTYPLVAHLAGMLHGRGLSLLNPYNFLTHSLASFPQAQTAYPPLLALAYLFPPQTALGMSVFLHHALLLMMTYCLARNLGLGRGAASVGAIAFGYCGPVVGRMDNLAQLSALAYLPALLALATLSAPQTPADRRADRMRWIAASFLAALTLLAGAPGTAIVVLATFAIVAVASARPPADSDGFASALSRAKNPLLTLAVAFFLAAKGIVPMLAVPVDEPLARQALVAHSISPSALPTLLIPFAYGSGQRMGHPLFPRGSRWGSWLSWTGLIDGPGPWFGPGDFGGTDLYLGVVPLLLLLLIGPRKEDRSRRDRHVATWVRLGVAVAALLALGVRGPLAAMWSFIPLPLAPSPSAFAALLALAIALQAARVLDGVLVLGDEDADLLSIRGTSYRTAGMALMWVLVCTVAWKAPVVLHHVYSNPMGPTVPDRRYELWPTQLRLSDPDRLWVLMGHCTLWGLWTGGLALALRTLLDLRRRAILAAGPLAFYVAALAYTDGGLMFARRAFDRVALDGQGLEGVASITTPAPLMARKGQIGPGRILIYAPDDAFAPGPMSLLPPVPGGPLQFRTGFANLLDPVAVVGGPDDAVPSGLRSLFGHWPPDPLTDGSALTLAGVGYVASAVPLNAPNLVPVMLDPRMQPPLRYYRLMPPPEPATIMRPLAPLGPGADGIQVLTSIRKRIPAAVVEAPGEVPMVVAAVPLAQESVVLTAQSASAVELRVWMSTRAYLVLPYRYDPDWTLFVNGMPQSGVRASGLEAARIDPGMSTVRLEFQPPGVELGQRISVVALILWLTWAAVALLAPVHDP